MTMKIEYDANEYETIELQEMNDNLAFKLVKFNTGIYGIISYNPSSKKEESVILLSPEQDKLSNTEFTLVQELLQVLIMKKNNDSKSCLNCKHCYDKNTCVLRDDLIEKVGCCWMWSQR